MSSPQVIIVGGGAAGFFAAIACAERSRDAEVTLLERGPQFLSKVRISGGGRCNVTHSCFEPRAFSSRYPRGERELIGLFHRFHASDTVDWFESRGVKLKTESDGRIFPVTDSSQTIVDCLMQAAAQAGVKMLTNRAVEQVGKRDDGTFALNLSRGEIMTCARLLLATGGCRTPALGSLAVSLGHTLEPPVPSLFTFHIETPWLRSLAGITVEQVETAVPGTPLRERGALLATHWGLSGPAILRLSAWGARTLHAIDYRFPLLVNWLPEHGTVELANEFASRRQQQPAKFVRNTPIAPLPARLWEQLVGAAGIPHDTRWAALAGSHQHELARQLTRTEFAVVGKSLNKEEFVTCGGVRLSEIDFKTMQSRICPGLFFAGELLDIDGITGGFNFQAAWTTGWLAGQAIT